MAASNRLPRPEYDEFENLTPDSSASQSGVGSEYLRPLLKYGVKPHNEHPHVLTVNRSRGCPKVDLKKYIEKFSDVSDVVDLKAFLGKCPDSQCTCPDSKNAQVADDSSIGDKVQNEVPKFIKSSQSSEKKVGTSKISKRKASVDYNSEDDFATPPPKSSKSSQSSDKKINISKRSGSDGYNSEEDFVTPVPKSRKSSQSSDSKLRTSVSTKNKSCKKYPHKSKIYSPMTLDTRTKILTDTLITKDSVIELYKRDTSNKGRAQSLRLSGVASLNSEDDDVQTSKLSGEGSLKANLSSTTKRYNLTLLKDMCENHIPVSQPSTGAPLEQINKSVVVDPSSVALPGEENNHPTVARSSSDAPVENSNASAVPGPSSYSDAKELILKSLEKYKYDTSFSVSQSLLIPGYLIETYEEVTEQNFGLKDIKKTEVTSSQKLPSETDSSDDDELSCGQKFKFEEVSLQESKAIDESGHQSPTPADFDTNIIPDSLESNDRREERGILKNIVKDVVQSSNLPDINLPVKNDGGLSSLGDRELFQKFFENRKEVMKLQKNNSNIRLEIAKRTHRRDCDRFDAEILKCNEKIARL